MRVTTMALVGTTLAVSACGSVDRRSVAGPPQFSHVQDLDGTPDLIVDAKRLADSWVVYDQTFAATLCSVVEGDVQPGDHRVLRFTVSTPDIGDADVFIGDPHAHIDPNGDGNTDDSDGLFEFATCHAHFHFRHYATYQLISTSGHVFKAAKRGFCMIDVTPWNNNDGGVGSWVYRSCGNLTLPGNQGISVGYADTYNKHLGGQFFVLDGGDGQDAVPPGDYFIRIEVNPGFTPAAGEPCPVLDPSTGLCHNFRESDYSNNVALVPITIPDHPGKTGFGPGKNDISNDDLVDDENRPDK